MGVKAQYTIERRDHSRGSHSFRDCGEWETQIDWFKRQGYKIEYVGNTHATVTLGMPKQDKRG